MSIRRALALTASFALGACGLSVAGVGPDRDPSSMGEGGAFGGALADGTGSLSEAGGNAPSSESGVEPGIDSGVGVTDGPPVTTDPNGCPQGRGPAMVKVGKICFDATPVTKAQYTVFLVYDGPDATAAPQCTRASHSPSPWPQPGLDTLPVVSVDWCDADAFCKWSGKQLCGNLSGGPLIYDGDHLNRIEHDAWYVACSSNGARTYPYGNTYLPGACNLGSNGLRAVNVGTICTGGYAGLFDMLGNVWEHVNACVGNECIVHGAAFKTQAVAATTCRNTIEMKRTDRFDDMGIRCCAYLP